MKQLTSEAIAAARTRFDELSKLTIPVQLGIERPRLINAGALRTYLDAVIVELERPTDEGEPARSIADLAPHILLDKVPAFFDSPKKAKDETESAEVTLSSISNVPLTTRVPALRPWPAADVFPGLVALMGATGSGKSELLRNTYKPDVLVRWGEPYEMYDAQPNVLHPSSVEEVIAITLVFGALGYTVAVDSIRTLVFKLRGPASEGGIISVFYTLLTDLSNLYVLVDAAVIVVVNPMVREEMIPFVFKQTTAATAGGILCQEGSVQDATFRKQTGRVFLKAQAAIESAPTGTFPEKGDPIDIGQLDDPVPAHIRGFRGDAQEESDRGQIRQASHFDL